MVAPTLPGSSSPIFFATFTGLCSADKDVPLIVDEGVHVDRVLDDERRDGDERQDQHVEDEELLAGVRGRVDLVAENPPDGAGHHGLGHRLDYFTDSKCLL